MNHTESDCCISSGDYDIHVIRVKNHRLINYNYLVVDRNSRESVIVDPAWEMEKIEDVMERSGSTLKGILLTHGDHDHTHLAKPMSDKYACPIWMSAVEINASGFKDARLIGIGGSPWPVGSMIITPILTPGHTVGSTCYLIGDNLFSGDTLFAEGCGICQGADAAQSMFQSLELLKRRILPHTLIFPGHSYGKPVGEKFSSLLRENIYLQFQSIQQFVAYRLRKGQDYLKYFSFF